MALPNEVEPHEAVEAGLLARVLGRFPCVAKNPSPRKPFFAGLLFGAVCLNTTFASAQGPASGQTVRVDPVPATVRAGILEALKTASTRFDRTHPDFSVMDARLSKAQLIGLGQQTHGSREIFEAQCAFFKYLVEKHGVRTLLFEDSFASMAPINDYIAGKEEPSDGMLNGTLTIWRVKPLWDLYRWMRDWNRQHPSDRVEVVGADLGSWTFDAYEKTFLAAIPTSEVPSMKPIIDRLRAAHAIAGRRDSSFYANMDLDAQMEARIDCLRLVRRFEKSLIGNRNPERVAAFMAARTLLGALEFFELMARAIPARAGKTVAMVAGVDEQLAARERSFSLAAISYSNLLPEKKMALWAHTTHLHKNTSDGWMTMGSYITAAKGAEAYFVATFTTAGGKVRAMSKESFAKATDPGVDPLSLYGDLPFSSLPDSLEAMAERYGEGRDLIIDTAKGSGSFDHNMSVLHLPAILSPEEMFLTVEPAKSFDFVVFLGRTGPTELLRRLEGESGAK